VTRARHTPGIRKVDDENPNEDDRNPASGFVFVEGMLVGSNDTGDDEVTRSHANRTSDEDLLASNLINPKNGRDCKEEFHDADHAGCEERNGVAA
jgi:hypothetical protein